MSVPYFLLFTLAVVLVGMFLRWAVNRWRTHQNAKLFKQSLTAAQIKILSEQVPLYRKLPNDLRAELQGNIQIFLRRKIFVGCAGLEVTEQMKLVVAANACLLLFGRKSLCFPGFQSILIYPDSYQVPHSSRQGDLEVQQISHRAGESWHRGPVILSWGNVIRGSTNGDDGFNVVLHEFAHKLDEQNNLMDGLPILRETADYPKWAQVLNREFESLKTDLDQNRTPKIDPYGATSPVEFFAVITESFFEKPANMLGQMPDLYQQLAKFYGLDPANW